MSPWQGGRQRSATLWPGQGAHYGFGWALSRQASRTSILLAQPVDSPLCSCATYATASCALIAPGHAELAALSRLALALLGAWFCPRELRCRPWIRTAWGVDPRLWGARGPKQCPFGWLSGELPMASASFAFCSLEGASRCRSRSGRGLAAGSGTLGRGGQPGIGPRSRVVGWAAGQPSFSPASAQAVQAGAVTWKGPPAGGRGRTPGRLSGRCQSSAWFGTTRPQPRRPPSRMPLRPCKSYITFRS